jgi:ABC-2 type transport system permease protein
VSSRALVGLVKKELLEIFGDRQARRGGLVQGVVSILVLGVFVPGSQAGLWVRSDPGAIFFFGFLPGIAAASIAADSFAGERERHTLETLLATPLAERTILVGKIAAAVTFGFLITTLGLIVALVTVRMASPLFAPTVIEVAGALGAGLVSALLMSAVATVVSMKVTAARSAQQITSIGSMIVMFTSLAAGKALGFAGTWGNAFRLELGGLVAAFAVLEIARVLFRRARFFEDG